MPKREYCRLCDALSGRLDDGEFRPCDTILYRTTSFVLLPAIGPLIDGHAMIVSKKHFTSLTAMSEESLAEYAALTQMLRDLPTIGSNLLEAEHGGITGDLAGGCIAHTHINILPGLASSVELFTTTLSSLSTLTSIEELKQVGAPYIMIRGIEQHVRLFEARGLPTQFIRRTLAVQLGVADWNWRTAPEPEGVQRTINFWNIALADELAS
jgi:diadenosine tetraphosphate (Ap4A) HIT family hydrolase